MSRSKKSPKAAAEPVSIQDRVRQELQSFSDAERRVAHALLGEYPLAGLETVARFAKRAGTSGPTILRFIGRLGYANYAEFQDALRSEIHISLQGPLTRYPTLPRGEQSGIFDEITDAICKSVARRRPERAARRFRADRHRLCDLDRGIFLLGGRFSWMLASYFHHYLRELRPGARIVRDFQRRLGRLSAGCAQGRRPDRVRFPALPEGTCWNLPAAPMPRARRSSSSPTSGTRRSRPLRNSSWPARSACPALSTPAFPGLPWSRSSPPAWSRSSAGAPKDRIAGLETLRHNFKLGD